MYVWIWRHLPGTARAASSARCSLLFARGRRAAAVRGLPVDRAAPADQPGHRAGQK